MYKLNCPTCKKQRTFTSEAGVKQAKRNKSECRSCATKKYANRNSELNNLKNRNYEFYYWLGFILADGHVSKNHRLTVVLGKKDTNHLKKLNKYLGNLTLRINDDGQPSISVMNKTIIKSLKNDFDIKSNKTENPPDFSYYKNIEYNKLKCLLIGFIDGDGSIRNQWKRKNAIIIIKCHGSWLKFLKGLYNKLNLGSEPYINKDGYTVYNITAYHECLALKNYTNWKDLPILKRKWNKIKKVDITRSSRLKLRILVYIKQGKTGKWISNKLNVNKSYISKLRRKYGCN